jgi:hypothetical protein
MSRPRTFVWVLYPRGPSPQIVFDDPRVGCADLTILGEWKIDPADTRTLEQLAAACPPPSETI